MAQSSFQDPLAERLVSLMRRGNVLVAEGLPFPVDQVRRLVENLRAHGEATRAEQALGRAERLLERSERDWTLLREILRRVDELVELARKAGLSTAELDGRVGNPREVLREGRLSEGLLERASTVASKRLTVLNDLLPQFLVREARQLGTRIRSAEKRGEDVGEATDRFEAFVRALRSGHVRQSGAAFLELRRAVQQLPTAPAFAVFPRDEQEEILREARQLARRINRMKTRARDASGAARLMGQVRAALSEERRVATPEEEIEELWNEVDRLSRERSEARPVEPAPRDETGERLDFDPSEIPPELLDAANGPLDEAGGRNLARRPRRSRP